MKLKVEILEHALLPSFFSKHLKCILEVQTKSRRETPEWRGSILANVLSLNFYSAWQWTEASAHTHLHAACSREGVSLCSDVATT